MDVQAVKQRFEIIGNSPKLNRAIEIATQVAATDMSVLITGESGTGKEVFPKIIHQFSARKHGQYIAVNCGAIPEGTIDSELFGHEKGSFTGAHEKRKGYFEVADGGTIFLDEVAELPLSTQVRLLRILETGEFLKVGSSTVLKTNVRVVAATNVNLIEAIQSGRFREDLYYRLNTVPITIPPLRDRKEDILLLFRKFSADFAEKYRMPAVKLTDPAKEVLLSYRWDGNIRQLKNITEQVSVLEGDRVIEGDTLKNYLPNFNLEKLPAIYNKGVDEKTFSSEREILYKVLFDMKKDMTELKKIVSNIIQSGTDSKTNEINTRILKNMYPEHDTDEPIDQPEPISFSINKEDNHVIQDTEEIIEESLSLEDKEKELIKKALEKHGGRRKQAAIELGISERTLYRKIKEYDLNE
ncbi:MAG: sigma-54-dependent Fis family transcriptional regulator [Marinilabiliales bacterium]|nr:MAG: sigma-54-dependent Fis family transcriptional regulator [Marinilabiliales bacterium]